MLSVKYNDPIYNLKGDGLNIAFGLNIAELLTEAKLTQKAAKAAVPAPIPQNPFRPGAGTKPLYLAGRNHEQTEFTRALNQSPLSQNIIITGLRGVGKTVLLDELKPIAHANNWLWTGNDLSEQASMTENSVATWLVVDLSALLKPLVSYREEELPFDSFRQPKLQRIALFISTTCGTFIKPRRALLLTS